MSYYTVDACNIAAYGNLKLPSLDNIVNEVEALNNCEKIIEEIKKCKRNSSGVHASDGSASINKYQRSSESCIVAQELYREIENRLSFVVNYHVPGGWKIAEGIQFLCYDAKNSGHFNMHTDSAYYDGSVFKLTSPNRKLTTVTYLNDNYQGGELVLGSVRDPIGKLFNKRMPAGTMIIFPSDIRFPHEVKPVTRGQRYSIVAWFDYN